MANRLLSKSSLAKLLVSSVLSASSLGTASVAMAASSTSAAETASLDKLVLELQQLHLALVSNPSGLQAVQNVEANTHAALPSVWGSLVYGQSYNSSNSTQLKFATTVGNMVALVSYANGADYTTAKANAKLLLQQIDILDGQITQTNLYDFYEKFKTDLENAAITQVLRTGSGNVSFTSIVDSALQDAATNTDGGVFSGFLTTYGLHVSDLATIRQNITKKWDAQNAALNALVSAAASSQLAPVTSISVSQGASWTYHLYISSTSQYAALAGFPIPNTLVTWSTSNPNVATVDSTGTVRGVAPGTATITAYIHGYPVASFQQNVYVPYVPPTTNPGTPSTGGTTPGGTTPPGGTPGTPGTTGPGGTPNPPATGDVKTVEQTSIVLAKKQVDTTGGTVTAATGSGTIQISVPAGAFSTPETITVSSTVDIPTLVQTLSGNLPSGFKLSNAIGVSFSGAAPKVPITITIQDPSIPAGAEIFKVLPTGLEQMDAVVTDGQAKISISTDPYFIIATPKSSSKGGKTGGDQGGSKPGGNKGGGTGQTGGIVKGPKVQITHKVIYLGGKKFATVPGFTYKGTTYMPLWYTMQALSKLGFHSTWNGTTWSIQAPKNIKPNWAHVAPGHGAVSIDLNGKLVQNVTGYAEIDPATKRMTAYMPIWYVMQVLTRTDLDSKWNGINWHLVWNQAALAKPKK